MHANRDAIENRPIYQKLAPFRVAVFSKMTPADGVQFRIISCSKMEPGRLLDLLPCEFECEILRTYVDVVSQALQHPDTLSALRKGALSSAPRYTIGNMVNLYQNGIRACLSTVP
jgi:hypothetical protein